MHHLNKPLFGAIDDSAPDRWGRLLMRRAERKNAKKEKRTARALREIDFLLMVDDEARQGALRFKREEQGPFLTTYNKNHIPPLVAVGKVAHCCKSCISKNQILKKIFGYSCSWFFIWRCETKSFRKR